MFKSSSFEEEIYRSMEKQLVSSQLEETHGFNKLAKAADYLHAAAEIFEQAGMIQEATEITKVLQSMATDQLSAETFSVSDLAGLDEKDLHNILEMSTPAQLFHIAKKVSSVSKGESSIMDEVKSSLKEMDLSDPEVRNKMVSKIMSALKVAKFFA